MESGGYSSIHSHPQHEMKVSGQLYAQGEPLIPIG